MTSFRFTQIIILASLLMGTSASSFAQETAESVSRVFKGRTIFIGRTVGETPQFERCLSPVDPTYQ